MMKTNRQLLSLLLVLILCLSLAPMAALAEGEPAGGGVHPLMFQAMAPKDGVYVPVGEPWDGLELFLDAPGEALEGIFYLDDPDRPVPFAGLEFHRPIQLTKMTVSGAENAGLDGCLVRVSMTEGRTAPFIADVATHPQGTEDLFALTVVGYTRPPIDFFYDEAGTLPVREGDEITAENNVIYARVDLDAASGQGQTLTEVIKSGMTPDFVDMTEVEGREGLYRFAVDTDRARPQGGEFDFFLGLRFFLSVTDGEEEADAAIGANVGLSLSKVRLVWREWVYNDQVGKWQEDAEGRLDNALEINPGMRRHGSFYLLNMDDSENPAILDPEDVTIHVVDQEGEGLITDVTEDVSESQIIQTNRDKFLALEAAKTLARGVARYTDGEGNTYAMAVDIRLGWAEFYTSPMARAEDLVAGRLNAYENHTFYLVLQDGPEIRFDRATALTDGNPGNEDDNAIRNWYYDGENRTFVFEVDENFIRNFQNGHIRLEWKNVGGDGHAEPDSRELELYCQGMVFWEWVEEGGQWHEALDRDDLLRVPFNVSPGAQFTGAFYDLSSFDLTPHLLFPDDQTLARFAGGVGVAAVVCPDAHGDPQLVDVDARFLEEAEYVPGAWEGHEGAAVCFRFPRQELDGKLYFTAHSQEKFVPVHSGLPAAAFFTEDSWDCENLLSWSFPLRTDGQGDTIYLVFRTDWGPARYKTPQFFGNLDQVEIGDENDSKIFPLEVTEGEGLVIPIRVKPDGPAQVQLHARWTRQAMWKNGEGEWDYGEEQTQEFGVVIRRDPLCPVDLAWSGNTLSLPETPVARQASQLHIQPNNIFWTALSLDDSGTLLDISQAECRVDGPFQLITAANNLTQTNIADGDKDYILGLYCTDASRAHFGRLRATVAGREYIADLVSSLGDGGFYTRLPDFAQMDMEEERKAGWPSLYRDLVNSDLTVSTDDTFYFIIHPDVMAQQPATSASLAGACAAFAEMTPVTGLPGGVQGVYRIKITDDTSLRAEGTQLTVQLSNGVRRNVIVKHFAPFPDPLNNYFLDKAAGVARCRVEYTDPSGTPPLLFCAFYDKDDVYLGAAFRPQPVGNRGSWEVQVELPAGAERAKFMLTDHSLVPYGAALGPAAGG